MINPPMVYSQSGYHLTEQFEGCKFQSYQDSGGIWTIGFGHTSGVTAGMTCTESQAEIWMQKDIQGACDAVNRLVNIQLTQGEFDACVDFVFNLGQGNFSNSTFLRLLNENNILAAASEIDKWDRCGGRVLAGLLRRRQAETTEFNGDSGESQT